MRQYYPRNVKMPEAGDVRELVNRQGQVVGLGTVIGTYPHQRTAVIKELEITEEGRSIGWKRKRR